MDPNNPNPVVPPTPPSQPATPPPLVPQPPQPAPPLGAPQPPGQMYVPPKKSSSTKTVLIVIGIVILGIVAFAVVAVVVLGSVFAVAVNSTKQQAQEATQFVNDIQNNSLSNAYSLTSPTYQKIVPESQFATQVKGQTQGLSTASPQITNRSINETTSGSTATISMDIPSNNSQTTSQHTTIKFVKESNGDWVIDSFNFANGLSN